MIRKALVLLSLAGTLIGGPSAHALVSDSADPIGDQLMQLAALGPVPTPLMAPRESDAGPAAVQTPARPPTARPDINPFNRDLDITVPLTFNRRVLGELPVRLTRDDRYFIDSKGFVDLIAPMLNESGRKKIVAALDGIEAFEDGAIGGNTGIELIYDPTALSVLVLRIDASLRNVEDLFDPVGRDDEEGAPPAAFSAYMNGSVSVLRQANSGDVRDPSVFLNGAMRFRRLVLEADFDGKEDLGTGQYEINRNYTRFVYDEPEKFRRWFAGDLEPETRGRQGYVDMGGLGVSRERRRFDTLRPGVLSGDRRLLLRRDSTVRVMRNGALVREFRLDAGQYDISSLPLQTGTNDVQIEIRDDAGTVERVNYEAYLDPIDLSPGDYEYGAYLGMTSELSVGSPDYSDGDLAFSGFYRKAFYTRPAVGVGVQASKRVQAVTAQQQYLLPNAARVQIDVALSNSETVGEGYGASALYDMYIDRGTTTDGLSMQVEYVSASLATLGNQDAFNDSEWIFSGQYSRLFNEKMFGAIDASYRKSRTDLGDSYRVAATTNYRVSRTTSVQVGVDYTKYQGDSSRDGAGVTVALVWQPSYDKRMDVRYASAANAGSASFIKSGDGRVGAIGYSALTTYDDGPASVSGSVDYTSNRFEGAISHTAFGEDIGSVTDEQVTQLRLSSSVAFAGGKVAVGRPISDSFALVYPHKNLKGRKVIVGDSLETGRYVANSGALGPAEANYLGSYVNQTLRYDVIDVPQGYDIGEGIKRLKPTYRSGYAIQVGTDAFVSALGVLMGENGKPIPLTSGRMTDKNGQGSSEPFFTNSVGRFAAQKLTPGHTYRVELNTTPAVGFEFTVPADNEGLLDLGRITIPVAVD
jgi:outer membrane usher protein